MSTDQHTSLEQISRNVSQGYNDVYFEAKRWILNRTVKYDMMFRKN